MDQKEQKEHIIKLANLVRQTGEIYSRLITSPAVDKTQIQSIFDLEEEGDKIQSVLDNNFLHEKNIPYLALDRAKLVRRLDDVLDHMIIAARTLVSFSPYVKEDFSEKIQNLAKVCKDITNELATGVEVIYKSFNDAMTCVKSIEDLRDQASNDKFALELEIFASEETNWKQYESSRRILDQTLKIITHTKEASEILQIMALKYV